jgi:hypothetical protein
VGDRASLAANAPRRRHSIHRWHRDVHDHEVRTREVHEVEHLAPVRRLQHLVPLGFQQRSRHHALKNAIVRENDRGNTPARLGGHRSGPGRSLLAGVVLHGRLLHKCSLQKQRAGHAPA